MNAPSITHQASTIRGMAAKSEKANMPARIPDAAKLNTRDTKTTGMAPTVPIPRRAKIVALPKPMMARNESTMAVMELLWPPSYSPGQRY